MQSLKKLIARAASMFGMLSVYKFYPPKGKKMYYDQKQRFVKSNLKKPQPYRQKNK